MNGDLCLPLVGISTCGYCERPLILQPEGDWACSHCRPLLAEVTTVEEWAAFQRRVRTVSRKRGSDG